MIPDSVSDLVRSNFLEPDIIIPPTPLICRSPARDLWPPNLDPICAAPPKPPAG